MTIKTISTSHVYQSLANNLVKRGNCYDYENHVAIKL